MDDLAARKFHFIEELMTIDDEKIIEALELVLQKERKGQQTISPAQMKALDERLKSYNENPEDLLDWQEVKKDL